MSYMDINCFLEIVEKEALGYPNISQDYMDLFGETVIDLLLNPNAHTDGCIYDQGIWYIALPCVDCPELTAENLDIVIKNGESIEHFAGRVVGAVCRKGGGW